MMLPQNTHLGDLHYLEIYDFYDMPALFACINNAGQIYISVWLDETAHNTTWLYVPVSTSRFAELRTGKIDLNKVFMQPEDGYVFEIKISSQIDGDDTITEISANELTSDSVPMPDSYIEDVTNLPRIVWGNIDQSSGRSNLIDTWLNEYKHKSSYVLQAVR